MDDGACSSVVSKVSVGYVGKRLEKLMFLPFFSSTVTVSFAHFIKNLTWIHD